jgi:hypothetical protein
VIRSVAGSFTLKQAKDYSSEQEARSALVRLGFICSRITRSSEMRLRRLSNSASSFTVIPKNVASCIALVCLKESSDSSALSFFSFLAEIDAGELAEAIAK